MELSESKIIYIYFFLCVCELSCILIAIIAYLMLSVIYVVLILKLIFVKNKFSKMYHIVRLFVRYNITY